MSFGSSKSDSSQKTTTNVSNQQVGASQGSTAIGAGSTVSLNTTLSDSGAISAAQQIAQQGIAANSDVSKSALDFGGNTVGESYQFVSGVLDKQIAATQSAQQGAQDAANVANELAASTIKQQAPVSQGSLNQDAQKYMLYGILGLGAIFVFVSMRKKAA